MKCFCGKDLQQNNSIFECHADEPTTHGIFIDNNDYAITFTIDKERFLIENLNELGLPFYNYLPSSICNLLNQSSSPKEVIEVLTVFFNNLIFL